MEQRSEPYKTTVSNPVPWRKSGWDSLACLAAIIAGVGLRLHMYLRNRSLWIDEARLALNLVERSYLGLLQPLDYDQGAPLGFLLIQKFAISLLGNHDIVLRLFPWLCGLIAIPLFYRVAQQYLNFDHPTLQKVGALMAVWLFALSTRLIYYGSECKQYSSDVLVALLLLWLAGRYLQGHNRTRSLVLIGLAGALALWFSHPALFVLSGILLAIGFDCLVRRNWQLFRLFLLMSVVTAASLGLDYLVSLRFLSSNSYLLDFWQYSFAPLPPWKDLPWFSQVWKRILYDPLRLPVHIFSLFILAVGVVSLGLRRRLAGLLMIAPIFLTLAASGVHRYPFGERMLLFLMPAFLLLLVEGVGLLWRVFNRWNRWLAWSAFAAVMVYFLFSYTTQDLRNLSPETMREHIKPLLTHVQEAMQPEERLFIYYSSVPAFRYYAPQYGFDPQWYLIGSDHRENPTAYLDEINSYISENRRVWFLFSHNCNWCQVNEEAYIVDHLNRIGRNQEAILKNDASLYLYSFP